MAYDILWVITVYEPDPAEWVVYPYAMDGLEIAMEAKIGFDKWFGYSLEYKFERKIAGIDPNDGSLMFTYDDDSGWLKLLEDGLYTGDPGAPIDPDATARFVDDSGLIEDQLYSYTVTVRDLLVDDNRLPIGHETAPSSPANVIATSDPSDGTAPTPDPSEWETDPYSVSTEAPFAISITAALATDDSGNVVEYLFHCIEEPLASSGWQMDRTWTHEDLVQDQVYTYMVMARDVYNNRTAFSEERSAIAGDDTGDPDPVEDYDAPTACGAQGFWDQLPSRRADGTDYYDDMTVCAEDLVTATENLEYFFESSYGAGSSPGWLTTPSYSAPVETAGAVRSYTVYIRDEAGNMTISTTETSP